MSGASTSCRRLSAHTSADLSDVTAAIRSWTTFAARNTNWNAELLRLLWSHWPKQLREKAIQTFVHNFKHNWSQVLWSLSRQVQFLWHLNSQFLWVRMKNIQISAKRAHPSTTHKENHSHDAVKFEADKEDRIVRECLYCLHLNPWRSPTVQVRHFSHSLFFYLLGSIHTESQHWRWGYHTRCMKGLHWFDQYYSHGYQQRNSNWFCTDPTRQCKRQRWCSV